MIFINHEDLIKFLNLNRIFELGLEKLTQELPKTIDLNLRSLKIYDDSF
jgi:hypothetical protein